MAFQECDEFNVITFHLNTNRSPFPTSVSLIFRIGEDWFGHQLKNKDDLQKIIDGLERAKNDVWPEN
jgi:hypothetical protein